MEGRIVCPSVTTLLGMVENKTRTFDKMLLADVFISENDVRFCTIAHPTDGPG